MKQTADFLSPSTHQMLSDTNYMNKHPAFVRHFTWTSLCLGRIITKLCCRQVWHQMNVGTQYEELKYAALRLRLKGFCHSVSPALTSPPTRVPTTSEVPANLKGLSFTHQNHRDTEVSVVLLVIEQKHVWWILIITFWCIKFTSCCTPGSFTLSSCCTCWRFCKFLPLSSSSCRLCSVTSAQTYISNLEKRCFCWQWEAAAGP